MAFSEKVLLAIAKNIQRLRNNKAWSQEELADRANLGVNTVGDAEAGRRQTSFPTVKKIARALGVSVEELTRDADHVGELHLSMAQLAPRAFFGIGKITVAVPLRNMHGRKFPVISSEDDRARRLLLELLSDLSIRMERFQIPPNGHWNPPAGEVIAICGQLNSPLTVEALSSDPLLTFDREADTGLWTIRCRDTGRRFVSPMDVASTTHNPTAGSHSDMAYIGRLAYRGRSLLIIAGIHAIGSVGAVHYLTTNLVEIFSVVGTRRFSMVVQSEHDGETVLRSELVCAPRIHH